MGYATMPELGEPTTCDGPCKHRDCAAWRRDINAPCAICAKPVKPGQNYYLRDGAPIHTTCAFAEATAQTYRLSGATVEMAGVGHLTATPATEAHARNLVSYLGGDWYILTDEDGNEYGRFTGKELAPYVVSQPETDPINPLVERAGERNMTNRRHTGIVVSRDSEGCYNVHHNGSWRALIGKTGRYWSITTVYNGTHLSMHRADAHGFKAALIELGLDLASRKAAKPTHPAPGDSRPDATTNISR